MKKRLCCCRVMVVLQDLGRQHEVGAAAFQYGDETAMTDLPGRR